MSFGIFGPLPRNLGIASLVVSAAIALSAQSELRAADNDGKAIECELLGGDVVTQPAGSAITACCYEGGCWICDAQGNDCTFEPVADRVGPSSTIPGRPPSVTVPGFDTPGVLGK